MKKLSSILIFASLPILGLAQISHTKSSSKKYFVSTNSGLQKTPVGLRVGILDKVGGYLGARFGNGHTYEKDLSNTVIVSEGTLFSTTAGLIFPIFSRNKFALRGFAGLGYGKWFDRLSNNGQTVGFEIEGGLMVSTGRLLVNFSGNRLAGDGNEAVSDYTLGLGYIFNKR